MCNLLSKVPPSGELLFQMSQARFRTLFTSGRLAAGVSPAVPHQLRHGGASHDALSHVSDAEMLARGPWKSTSSLARYRRPARFVKALAELPPAQVHLALAAPTLILKELEILSQKL